MSEKEDLPHQSVAGPPSASPNTGTGSAATSRVVLTDSELDSISLSELASKWRLQDAYVGCLEQRLSAQEGRYSHSLLTALPHIARLPATCNILCTLYYLLEFLLQSHPHSISLCV